MKATYFATVLAMLVPAVASADRVTTRDHLELAVAYRTDSPLARSVLLGSALLRDVHLHLDDLVAPSLSLGGEWTEPDIARLALRVDYRVSSTFSITPQIGGSLGVFAGANPDVTTGYEELADKEISFVGFAGVSGRFQ